MKKTFKMKQEYRDNEQQKRQREIEKVYKWWEISIYVGLGWRLSVKTRRNNKQKQNYSSVNKFMFSFS